MSCAVCRFLEDELARRYRDAAPSTLALLQKRCEAVTDDLKAVNEQLKAVSDVASLRKSGEVPLTSSCPLFRNSAAGTARADMQYSCTVCWWSQRPGNGFIVGSSMQLYEV